MSQQKPQKSLPKIEGASIKVKKLTGENSICPTCGNHLYENDVNYKNKIYTIVGCVKCKTPSKFWEKPLAYVMKIHKERFNG